MPIGFSFLNTCVWSWGSFFPPLYDLFTKIHRTAMVKKKKVAYAEHDPSDLPLTNPAL